jgi:peptidyl-prolyl cis-trans isomerase D
VRNKQKKLWYRIILAGVVALLGLGMLLYLVPGQGTMGAAPADVIAQVNKETVTVADVRNQLSLIERDGTIPQVLAPLYAQQVLNQLVFQKELDYEAGRLGIRVTDQERADRIRELIPTAFAGDSFVGMEQYTAQVEARTGMSVPEFESLVGESLLEEKFRQLVTDGITVTPEEVQQEFRRRNEKVKISYVVVNPDSLQPKINPSDAELQAYFEKNHSRYTVPERRTVQYALLDVNQLSSQVNVPDAEVQAYYNQHIDRYKVQGRAHVAHILFKTVGKTDAEVAEIRKKAEEVLKMAKSGANFADLAKKYSEDTTADKGGDLGWIVRGQTVPQFENAAFSLPKDSISDLVQTEYGFDIIKVIDRQEARTQTLDEVRASIASTLKQQKAQKMADNLSEQVAEEIRRSGRVPMADLAKKFNLTLGETQPLEAGQTIPDVGKAPGLADTVFHLRVGDLTEPIRTDRGYVVLSVKQVQPAHPGTLAEVHEKVLADYRHDKAVELAKSEAQEVARRAKAGEDLDKVAKSLGLEVQTSALFARNASLQDVGTASEVAAAFTLPVGQTSDAHFLGANWVVFRVLERQPANPADLAKQKAGIEQQLLQQKQEMAFEAFQSELGARLQQQGLVRVDADKLKLVTNASS